MNYLSRITLITMTALCVSCVRYDVSINDRIVYTPAPLMIVEDSVVDPVLRQCLEKEIRKKQITHAGQLESLSCDDAGIQSLAGIEIFTQLKALSLEGNAISDISPLSDLAKLTHLNIQKNMIESIEPLQSLLLLEQLDIRQNPIQTCDVLSTIERQLFAYKTTINKEGICKR